MEECKTDEIQCVQRGVHTPLLLGGQRTVKGCFADIAVNHISFSSPVCHKTYFFCNETSMHSGRNLQVAYFHAISISPKYQNMDHFTPL